MARARTIKPAFFVNEDLGVCDPFARLLFIGLWTLSDRDGRLEDRPLRIKSQILPYDDKIKVDSLLNELVEKGFILRYTHENIAVIQILAFTTHQKPHPHEPSCNLPEYQENLECNNLSENVITNSVKQLQKTPYKDIREEVIGNRKVSKREEDQVKIGSHFKAKQEQIDDLIKQDGKAQFNARVQILNDYCASHGKTYKDYAAAYRQFRNRDQRDNKNIFPIASNSKRPEHKIVKAAPRDSQRDSEVVKSIIDKAFNRNENTG